MGLSKAVDAFFNDWVVAILAMPNLAWALFCSLAFGFGDTGRSSPSCSPASRS